MGLKLEPFCSSIIISKTAQRSARSTSLDRMASLSSVVAIVACFGMGGDATQGSLQFKKQLAAAPKPLPKVALISQLATAPAPANPAPPPAFPGDMAYDDEKYTAESWSKEWRNGNYPGYK